MVDQLIELQAPPDVVQAAQAWVDREAAAADIPIWPQHWHAVCTFVRLGTQWRKVYGARRTVYEGLRYSSVPLILRAVAAELPAHLRQPAHVVWRQVQQMERAVLEAQAEQG